MRSYIFLCAKYSRYLQCRIHGFIGLTYYKKSCYNEKKYNFGTIYAYYFYEKRKYYSAGRYMYA